MGCAAWVLTACGGGTNGDAQPQTRPDIVSLSGTAVLDDRAATDAYQMTVKGASGLARSVVGTQQTGYTAVLDQLTGPYAVSAQLIDGNTLVSLATRKGTANVTTLTTLVSAQASGQGPTTYFANLGNSGDASLAPITDAQLTLAQQRVTRFLAQNFGITVPGSIGSFITSPFSPIAGDPMFDTLTALDAQLAAKGTDIFTVANAVARQANFCNAEALGVAVGITDADFCPATKSAVADSTDGSIVDYRFADDLGAVLVVSGRGDDVLSATLTAADGSLFTCSGSGCAGLALGIPAGDLSRPLSFAAVTLTGVTSSAVLNGTLASSPPGVSLPPLPCSDNRYFIINPDNKVAATCAGQDPLGLGAGTTSIAGTTRRIYKFESDGSVDPVPPRLELRVDGQAVASLAVIGADPDTGSPVVLFKCVGAACNGVTVGPAVDDDQNFAPFTIRTRTVVLDHTVVAAIDPDGSPSSSGAASVVASFTSVEIMEPPPYPAVTAACASDSQRLTALPSDESAAIDECPPADPQGFDPSSFIKSSVDNSGNASFFIGSLFMRAGGNGPIGGISIQMDGSDVASVTFTYFDATYVCTGTACTGITVSPPNEQGERAITVDQTVLAEVETGGLPGDRTATINGSFAAPAPDSAAPAGSGRNPRTRAQTVESRLRPVKR